MTNNIEDTTATADREITFMIEQLVRSPRGANHIHQATRLREPYRDGNRNRLVRLVRKLDATQEAMARTSNEQQLQWAGEMAGAARERCLLMGKLLEHYDMTKNEFETIERVVYRNIVGLIVRWRQGHDERADQTGTSAA